ncbi:hypothetical protein C8Q75DRAFT_86094 [Abortiporus biennis]|nr:hypothetical protein C8Q75DRAFT_86094 [Abortiporus biennis]
MSFSYHHHTTMPTSFALIPPEVLEHIALYTACSEFLGPPSGLLSLLTLNHTVHAALSLKNNPRLYAQIFALNFDINAAIRRLGADRINATTLSEELVRRCTLLSRFRSRVDGKLTESGELVEGQGDMIDSMLWMAYLMMLENDGYNERQLIEYGRIDEWLKEFWFDPMGSSQATLSIRADIWPENCERMSLAMWLFWMLIKPKDDDLFRDATGILKLVALGAHKYPLCYPSWNDFIPVKCNTVPSRIRHFSTELQMVAPAPAAPAILSYLTLANALAVSFESLNYIKPLAPTVLSSVTTKSSAEWDGEWNRALSVGNSDIVLGNTLSQAFKPGCLDGVWEGLFTYTEFTSYAALLSGAPPATLQRSLVAQHRQTWKLREYHLLEYPSDVSEDEIFNRAESPKPLTSDPLGPGNPSRGYIPNGTEIRQLEGNGAIEVFERGRREPIIYRSYSSLLTDEVKKKELAKGKVRVKDIFVIGEGHSAWGQFSLIGRVRPSDGFISLSKEYVNGHRGKWLYRSYLVGDTNGNLSGRWRDTLTDPQMEGYEGCFVMSRRR